MSTSGQRRSQCAIDTWRERTCLDTGPGSDTVMADILQVNWKYTVANKTDKMEEEDKDYEPEEGSKYKLRAKKRKEMKARSSFM